MGGTINLRSIQELWPSLAKLVGLDVEVVDEELRLIAATGIHGAFVGMKLRSGRINRQVLITSKSFFVEDCRKDSRCMGCPIITECEYKSGIFAPIRLEGNSSPIAVLSLVAFDDEQNERLVAESKSLLPFAKGVAALLALAMRPPAPQDLLEAIRGTLELCESAAIMVNTDGKKVLTDAMTGLLAKVGSDFLKRLPLELSAEIGLKGKTILRKPVNAAPSSGFTAVQTSIAPIHAFGKVVGAVQVFHDTAGADLPPIHRATSSSGFEEIIGISEAICKAKSVASVAASVDSTVLLLGESGTGKELFAKAIHAGSRRSAGPFVPVNCAALPKDLLESELFGYADGAFTGARKGGKPGKVECAHQGTLFLDEIGEMPYDLQAKVLRFLEDFRIERLGSTSSTVVSVRVIAATNSDLKALVEVGKFRADLYFRLNVITIKIPALRDRKGDIPILCKHLVNKYAVKLGKPTLEITDKVLQLFLAYDWPGNVRELSNVIEYAVAFARGPTLSVEDLPEWFLQEIGVDLVNDTTGYPPFARALGDAQRRAILEALEVFGNTLEGKKKAAEALGISLATLYRKIKGGQ